MSEQSFRERANTVRDDARSYIQKLREERMRKRAQAAGTKPVDPFPDQHITPSQTAPSSSVQAAAKAVFGDFATAFPQGFSSPQGTEPHLGAAAQSEAEFDRDGRVAAEEDLNPEVLAEAQDDDMSDVDTYDISQGDYDDLSQESNSIDDATAILDPATLDMTGDEGSFHVEQAGPADCDDSEDHANASSVSSLAAPLDDEDVDGTLAEGPADDDLQPVLGSDAAQDDSFIKLDADVPSNGSRTSSDNLDRLLDKAARRSTVAQKASSSETSETEDLTILSDLNEEISGSSVSHEATLAQIDEDTGEPSELDILKSFAQDGDLTITAASPLKVIPTLGEGIVWRLNQMGHQSLGDLAQADPAQLTAELGPIGRLLRPDLWIAYAQYVSKESQPTPDMQ